MVDKSNPIDPFGHLKIEKIKEISDEKKNYSFIQHPVDKKLFLYLSFLNFFSNVLKSTTPKKNYSSLEQTPIHKILIQIKNSLESLKEKDLSKEPEFLNFFAYIWLKLFNDIKQYRLSDDKLNKLIKEFIQNIYSYPKDSEFSLGYYISELAGQKWIPFPYMEMLLNLHQEHKKSPSSSHLNEWVNLLEDILKA